jgi:hypothetical protein
MASRNRALPLDLHVQSHAAIHENELCDSHAHLVDRAIAGGWARPRFCGSRTAVIGPVPVTRQSVQWPQELRPALTEQHGLTLDAAFIAHPARFKGVAPRPPTVPLAAWTIHPKRKPPHGQLHPFARSTREQMCLKHIDMFRRHSPKRQAPNASQQTFGAPPV